MNRTRVNYILVLAVSFLFIASGAVLAEKGSFSAWAGFSAKVLNTFQMGEGELYMPVEFQGTIRDDKGNGMWHNAYMYGVGVFEVRQGKLKGSGWGITVDGQGNKIAGKFSCTGDAPNCSGVHLFDEKGTGKFANMVIEWKFSNTGIPGTPGSYSTAKASFKTR